MSYKKRYKISYDITISVDKFYTNRSVAVDAKHDIVKVLTDLMVKGVIVDYNITLEDQKLNVYL